MLGLSPTSSANPGPQLSVYQAQLQQARREAAQAQNKVTRLEAQAQVARQEAVRAEDEVRGLENQPPRASADTRPRKAINTLSQLSGTLVDTTA